MAMRKHSISVTVNGMAHQIEVPARRLLSDLLRDDLNLTGTKRGCETGICGACSVLLDGEVVKSCLSLAIQARGRSITTVEGLAQGGDLHPIQQAFMEHGGLQCGYCTPGMMIAASALLKHNATPSCHEVRSGLNGNLCRCTGYASIVSAIMSAAEKIYGS
jgi:aerobic carbon-monoxide dehydrogenase small subunit